MENTIHFHLTQTDVKKPPAIIIIKEIYHGLHNKIIITILNIVIVI